jgi:hypothetical protein
VTCAACAVIFWAPAALGLVGADLTETNPPALDLLAGRSETIWLLLTLVTGVVAWAAIEQTDSGQSAPAPRPASSRALWGWGVVHLVMVVLTGVLITRWAPITDDADVYRMQARLLLHGAVAEPAFPIRSAVTNLFVIDLPARDGLAQWSGCYPLLAGLWTAPGLALGFDNLLWVPLGALLTVQVGRLAEELWPDADGALAAGLVATSPTLVALGTTLHTSLLATLLAVAAARLGVRIARAESTDPAMALALGALLGLGVLARPLDGVLGLALAAVGLSWGLRRSGARLASTAATVALGGLPLAVVFAAHNRAVTGSPFVMPYDLILGGVRVYGFGDVWYGPHTPYRALVKTATALLRLDAWVLGWAALVPVAAYAATAWRDPRIAGLAVAAAAHFVLYALAPYGAVPTAGTTYHAWAVPLLVLVLVARWRGRGARSRAIALGVFGLVTFVPVGYYSLGRSAEYTRAPLVAAEELRREHGRVLIRYVRPPSRPARSAVYHAPIPAPGDAVLWIADDPDTFAAARAQFPDHVPLVMRREGRAVRVERAQDP